MIVPLNVPSIQPPGILIFFVFPGSMISERLSVIFGDAGLTGISSVVLRTSLPHLAVKEALAAPVSVPSKLIRKV